MKDLTGYLRKSGRFPLRPLRRDLALAPDKLFSEMKTHIINPPLSEQVRRAWISYETWSVIDAMVTVRRERAQ